MKSKYQSPLDFSQHRAGVAAIEYALMAAMIAVVIVAGVSSIGQTVGNLFDSIATQT
jgi:pilus assembly protein Flp/PilA